MNSVNIPKGYKQTKVGVIPEDWEVFKIDEILQRVSQKVDVRKDVFYQQIGIRSHSKGIFYKELVTGEKLGNKSVFWIKENCFIVNIVFAWEQAVAKTTSNEKGMIASHRFPMYKSKNNLVNIDYILYFFKTKKGKHFLGLASPGGAGRNKTLGQKEFNSLKIPLPPLNEQEKIAKILITWDKSIDLQEKLIKEKETYKLGLMQNLLTCKMRFKGFSGEWEVSRLKEIAKFRRGSFPQPYGLSKWYDDEDGFPFIQVYDVDTNFKLKSETKRKISELAIAQSVFIKKGTVIITIQGSIGRVAITQYDAYIDRTLLLFEKYYKPISKILFVHILRELFEKEKQKAPGGTIKTITKEALSNFKIKFPSLEEQQKISNFLSLADKEIELLKNKLAELKNQQKSLMQNLLSGKMRVKV